MAGYRSQETEDSQGVLTIGALTELLYLAIECGGPKKGSGRMSWQRAEV